MSLHTHMEVKGALAVDLHGLLPVMLQMFFRQMMLKMFFYMLHIFVRAGEGMLT